MICPNCIEPDENIQPMPDGSCGVCGGKGYIEWKKVGKINTTPSPIEFEEIEAPEVFSETIRESGSIKEFGFTDEFIKWVEDITDTINLLIKNK
jgi:hypothetical protein